MNLIGIFLYLLVLYSSVLCYIKQKYNVFICLFYLCITDFLGLLLDCTLHGRDCAFIIVLILLWNSKKSGVLQLNDDIGKSILLLVSWFILRTFFSILLEEESWLYSFLVLRFELFYLSYFVFKKIPLSQIESAVPFLFFTTILAGILQLFLYFSLGKLFVISPGALEICVIFCIFDKKLKYRKVLLVFFFILLFLGTSRGLIIALFLSLMIYVMRSRSLLKIFQRHLISIVCFLLVIIPLFIHKLSEDVGKGEGLLNESETIVDIVKNKSYYMFDHNMVYSEGTFAFRVGLVIERLDYLIEHPLAFLVGVGSVHEQSAQKLFDFYLGTITAKTIHNEGGSQGQIDTGDVSYITELLRYGFVYLFLFGLLIRNMFIQINNKNNSLQKESFVLLLVLLIRSFVSVPFMGSDFSFYFVMMIIASTNTVQINNSNTELCFNNNLYAIKK